MIFRCFQCSKDTKMGANHNGCTGYITVLLVVSNVPKILKWEQITTGFLSKLAISGCFQCSKDTKMGANHNSANQPHQDTQLFPMFQRY